MEPAPEKAILEERKNAETGACANSLSAASLFLNELQAIDQPVLSTPAVRKIMAAQCTNPPSLPPSRPSVPP